MKPINPIKDEIQQQAHAIWLAAGRSGTIAAGTGFGKSRIPILEMQRMLDDGMLVNSGDVLLVTPTEKLRDDNWPNEFADWGKSHLLDYVEAICFASLKKEVEKGKHRKLVILDEIHRLTEMSAQAFAVDEGEDTLTAYFAEALADAVIGLTATVPDVKRDPEKARIIAQIAPVVYRYTLDQGVEDGMIADYEIRVIQTVLNNTDKVIAAGSKAKPFKTTEAGHYEYLEKNIRKQRMLAQQSTSPKQAANFERLAMFATMARNRFIYSLPSKTALAASILQRITGEKRTLVFAGSIDQCNQLLGDQVYHSKSSDRAFNQFNNKEISVLGVVNAANEGINFTDLDQGLIVQVDSNERNLTQRIGRMLRVREGHKAIIYIIVVQNTADERWLEKSLAHFDKSKITYYSAKSIAV